MKKFFYLFAILCGLISIHSCKDLLEENGDPLLDMYNNSGLIGKRGFFREITDAGIIAEYQYNGLQLSKVINKQRGITNLLWSGDVISQLTFNGLVDANFDNILDDDSVSYNQQFNYTNLGRLTSITENKSIYMNDPNDTSGPRILKERSKSLYTLTYDAVNAKVKTITTKKGKETVGIPFAYTEYSIENYTYLGDNISKSEKNYGAITGTTLSPPTQKYRIEFSNFDEQINPYQLLPFGYKISSIVTGYMSDLRPQILSPNNAKRMSVTDLNTPIPNPILFSSDFVYDPQTYLTKGYGINYFYKPF